MRARVREINDHFNMLLDGMMDYLLPGKNLVQELLGATLFHAQLFSFLLDQTFQVVGILFHAAQ